MTVSPLDALMLTVLVAAVAAGAWDLRTGRIPNRLLYGLLGLGLALRIAVASAHGLGAVVDVLAGSALGLLACAPLPLGLYLLRSLGGGDLKLLCACGVCLGPQLGFELQLVAYGVGTVYGLGRVIFEGTLWKTLLETRLLVSQALPSRRGAPDTATALTTLRFAPAVSLSALIVTIAHWGQP